MKRLDNHSVRDANSVSNGRKPWVLLAFMVVALSLLACQKTPEPVADRASARPAAETIGEADQLYAGRADLLKVRQGIVSLRQVQASDQSNYELAWRLAKFNYYLAAHTPDSTEQGKSFHDGIEAGKLAVKLQDGKPEGHFWLGANYGGKAKTSMLPGLSDFNDIKRELETVLKLDESYQTGSAYMALGQLYLEAPGFVGGDTQKAIEYLEKGLRFGPTNALLRVHLAEAYAKANRNDDARKQIDVLLAMKPAAGYEPEHNEALAAAKKLQERIK